MRYPSSLRAEIFSMGLGAHSKGSRSPLLPLSPRFAGRGARSWVQGSGFRVLGIRAFGLKIYVCWALGLRV